LRASHTTAHSQTHPMCSSFSTVNIFEQTKKRGQV
jgi:hypothetical protein